MNAMWKRQQISLWLEQLYGDETVPEFELNDTTISHLYHMSTACQKNDTNHQLVVDDLQQKCDEYNAEGQRLAGVLSRMSLGPQQLSKSGNTSLLTLARLAKLLHVKDASDSSYYLALQSLDDELYKVEKQQAEEAKKLKGLTEKSNNSILKVESLKRTLDFVQQKSAEEIKLANDRMKDDTPFYKKKAKAYEKEIAKLQVKQEQVDPNISHASLINKSQHLSKLKTELTPLKEELQSYLILPPNLSQTKILIEQKKKELDQLEKQFSAQCEGVDSLDL